MIILDFKLRFYLKCVLHFTRYSNFRDDVNLSKINVRIFFFISEILTRLSALHIHFAGCSSCSYCFLTFSPFLLRLRTPSSRCVPWHWHPRPLPSSRIASSSSLLCVSTWFFISISCFAHIHLLSFAVF